GSAWAAGRAARRADTSATTATPNSPTPAPAARRRPSAGPPAGAVRPVDGAAAAASAYPRGASRRGAYHLFIISATHAFRKARFHYRKWSASLTGYDARYGASSARAACATEGAHALPAAVDLRRQRRARPESRGAADARASHRRARHECHLSLQRDPNVAR